MRTSLLEQVFLLKPVHFGRYGFAVTRRLAWFWQTYDSYSYESVQCLWFRFYLWRVQRDLCAHDRIAQRCPDCGGDKAC